jgi:acetyl-CoA C-acetyltransferase
MNPVAASRYEGACASGSIAFRSAYHSILSGKSDLALVIGAEKMCDIGGAEAVSTLAAASSQEDEASIGATFASLFALIARKHMHDYGTTQEQLALVSVNNHKNGLNNKKAQFRLKISVADVLNSSMIASPLRLLDCSPITDGASALILASEKFVKEHHNPVWVLGSAQGSDTISLHNRRSLTEMDATRYAAKKAFEEANVTNNAVDFIDVHDCFSINEIIALEDLGFCKKGVGGKFVEDGKIAIDGELPVNTTGGLKSIGHPVGATGIRQLADIAHQVRGDSCNQLKKADIGLALNIGGSGATAIVNILGKSRRW